MTAKKKTFTDKLNQMSKEKEEAATKKPPPGAGQGPEVLFATRVPKAYFKAVKMCAVQEETTIKDFITEAIAEALKRRGAL